FKYPLNPKLDYIKRVVGLPGDKVSYDPVNKRVTVQPACDNGQSCDKALAVTYNQAAPSDFVQMFSRSGMGEASNGFYNIPLNDSVPQGGIRLRERNETLGDVTHRVLTVPGTQDQVGAYYQQPGNQL